VNSAEDDSTAVSCPACGTSGLETFSNKLSDREIKRLKVYCVNKARGCEWSDEINEAKKHDENCLYGNVYCPNNCGMTLQRQFYDLHAEFECPNCESYCQLCFIIGKKNFIEGEHMEQCPKVTIPCPNHCEDTNILREDLVAHRNTCPLEKLKCEYFNLGCQVEVVRMDMEVHNTTMMSTHLSLTKKSLNKTANQLVNVKTALIDAKAQLVEKDKQLHETLIQVEQNQWPLKISSDASKSSYGLHPLPLIIRVAGMAGKQRRKQDWYSNGFLTNVGGYKLRLKMGLSGSRHTHMAIYTQIMVGPNDDRLLWPMKGKFVVQLLNQLSDNNHYKRILLYDDATSSHAAGRVYHGDRPCSWGSSSFISLVKLCSVSPTCQYMKDDCIYFKVSYQCP